MRCLLECGRDVNGHREQPGGGGGGGVTRAQLGKLTQRNDFK